MTFARPESKETKEPKKSQHAEKWIEVAFLHLTSPFVEQCIYGFRMRSQAVLSGRTTLRSRECVSGLLQTTWAVFPFHSASDMVSAQYP